VGSAVNITEYSQTIVLLVVFTENAYFKFATWPKSDSGKY